MQYFQLLSVTETRMRYGSIGPAIRGRLRLHLWHKVQSSTCLNQGSCTNEIFQMFHRRNLEKKVTNLHVFNGSFARAFLKSTIGKDLQVSVMHHNPSNSGSLILMTSSQRNASLLFVSLHVRFQFCKHLHVRFKISYVCTCVLKYSKSPNRFAIIMLGRLVKK